jgi:hypothetical protein
MSISLYWTFWLVLWAQLAASLASLCLVVWCVRREGKKEAGK